jgi:hypothetical protein
MKPVICPAAGGQSIGGNLRDRVVVGLFRPTEFRISRSCTFL